MYLSTSISVQDNESRQDKMDNDNNSDVLPEKDTLKDAESRAALRSSAVKYLIYNRNLLPMFACPGQLWHK